MNLEKLKEIGNEWIKGDYHRIYFDSMEFYGLEVTRYNTGNISSAKLDGELISNCQAKKIIHSLPEKFFYDVKKGVFSCVGANNEMLNELVQNVKQKAVEKSCKNPTDKCEIVKDFDLSGQLWEECEYCGQEPIYMSVGVCESCAIKGIRR